MPTDPVPQTTQAPLLFDPASIPEVAPAGAVIWCGYPASLPWADCLLWRRGGVKVPRDCGDCVHRLTTTGEVAHA